MKWTPNEILFILVGVPVSEQALYSPRPLAPKSNYRSSAIGCLPTALNKVIFPF